jgi:N,N-dimethylformamidase
MFEGVDEEIVGSFGTVGSGAAGLELDRYDYDLGSPLHAEILATSENLSQYYVPAPEEINGVLPANCTEQTPLVRGDMIFFETPACGAVFSVGSIAWAGSLSHNRYNNNVSTITRNVLRRFLDPTAF